MATPSISVMHCFLFFSLFSIFHLGYFPHAFPFFMSISMYGYYQSICMGVFAFFVILYKIVMYDWICSLSPFYWRQRAVSFATYKSTLYNGCKLLFFVILFFRGTMAFLRPKDFHLCPLPSQHSWHTQAPLLLLAWEGMPSHFPLWRYFFIALWKWEGFILCWGAFSFSLRRVFFIHFAFFVYVIVFLVYGPLISP